MLVSHDDGSTELLTLQDTSSPLISTYEGRQGGDRGMIGPLEIETLPNTPSPCPTSPSVGSQAEDRVVRTVEVEVEVVGEGEGEDRAVRAEQSRNCGRGDQSLPDSPASSVSQSQSDWELDLPESEADQVKF